jgi:hypothetical protein
MTNQIKELSAHLPKKKGKPRGRPMHVPTDVFRNQVLTFCGMGLTHSQIAMMLSISDETLRKYYRAELDKGEAAMNLNVATNLYTMATGNDRNAVTAAIFWLKTRARWSETKRVEHTGADGGAIQTEISAKQTIDSRKLTAEQRQALREILVATAAQQPVIEHMAQEEGEDEGDEGEEDDYGDEEDEVEEEGDEPEEE